MGKDLKGKECGRGIHQISNGTYEGRFTDRSGKRVSIYDRNLDRLKKKIDVEKTRVGNPTLIESGKTLKLSSWFNMWINVYKHDLIRPSTRRIYVHVFEKLIEPRLGNMALQDIKPIHVRSLLNDLHDNEYSYSTISKAKILLVDMFDKALLDDLVWKNVARGIRIPRDDNYERRVLTTEEQLSFLETAKGTYYYNLYVVALNTGMRIGEISALTPKDINFEKKEISINKSLTYIKYDEDEKKTFHLGPPKTNKSKRIIPITKECEIALKKQYMQNNIVKSKLHCNPIEGFEDLIFCTSLNGPICPQIIIDDIKRILKQINMMRDDSDQFESFSFHSFRHTFATRCFEAGMEAKAVQEILGHASIQMTMDLYTHVTDNKKKSEMDKFERTMYELEEAKESIDEQKYREYIEKEYKMLNKVKRITFG